MKADLLEPMVEAEKSLIWEHRQSLVLIPAALPKGSFSSRLYKGRASYGATSFTIDVAKFFCH